MLSGFTSADADTGLQALAWQHEADHSLWTRPEVEAPKTWQVNRSGLQPRRIVEWCDSLLIFSGLAHFHVGALHDPVIGFKL